MPASHRSRLEQRLPARPESITALRRAVVEYAARGGASARRREDIALAVSEALSNVVVHAYAGRAEPGDVRVHASIDDGALEIAVCDEGNGMTRRGGPGLGLGLEIMSQVSDRLRLESGGAPGLRVRMTFALD